MKEDMTRTTNTDADHAILPRSNLNSGKYGDFNSTWIHQQCRQTEVSDMRWTAQSILMNVGL